MLHSGRLCVQFELGSLSCVLSSQFAPCTAQFTFGFAETCLHSERAIAEFVDTPFGCNLQHTLVSLQPFPALVRATMDATTNVALAIAIEHGRFAAMEQVLLDRERAAMAAEDHRSLLVRLTNSSHVPSAMRWMWTAAYRHLQNDVLYLRGVIILPLRALLRNNIGTARMHLANEIDSDEDLEWP